MSYNVSAEFDDYRARYHWVCKGLDFLLEGTKYNQRNPRLYWNLGWFTGHKMGISDEKTQFRQMFRDDTDFHNSLLGFISVDSARGPDGKPDSWLVGYLWYLKAHSVAESGVPGTWVQLDSSTGGYADKRRSPVIFYSDPSMALMSHAEAVTDEMIPGEKTRNAWARAGTSWKAFGDMDIPTTFEHTVRLNNRDRLAGRSGTAPGETRRDGTRTPGEDPSRTQGETCPGGTRCLRYLLGGEAATDGGRNARVQSSLREADGLRSGLGRGDARGPAGDGPFLRYASHASQSVRRTDCLLRPRS